MSSLLRRSDASEQESEDHPGARTAGHLRAHGCGQAVSRHGGLRKEGPALDRAVLEVSLKGVRDLGACTGPALLLAGPVHSSF
jgi:hypothetical protein